MSTHALLSPSKADQWMTCHGSVALSKHEPDVESAYAQEGTNYHDLAKVCLDEGKDALEFVGMQFEDETEVTEENAEYLQNYLNLVRELHAQGGSLRVEEKVPIAQITTEPGGEGTSDAIIIREDEVVVIDLKFGRGVAVKAENNRQMKMYAAGAIQKHDLWDSVKRVRMIICQPRVMDGVSEATITIEELLQFTTEARMIGELIFRAEQTGESLPLVPSEKACRFCKAKPHCPALFTLVEQATTEGFEDLDQPSVQPTNTGKLVPVSAADRLGSAMKLADLAEIWMKGVRAKVEVELLANRPVTGFKLVQGRKGGRKWTNAEAIEEWLKKKRVKHADMYDYKLISPTTAEKKWKKSKPAWWEELNTTDYIKQSEGGIHVAPLEDPREAYIVESPAAGFDETFDDLL